MDRDRKTAMHAGLLFLATIVFSIPAVGIYGKVRTDPNYVVGVGQDARVYLGAFLELLTQPRTSERRSSCIGSCDG